LEIEILYDKRTKRLLSFRKVGEAGHRTIYIPDENQESVIITVDRMPEFPVDKWVYDPSTETLVEDPITRTCRYCGMTFDGRDVNAGIDWMNHEIKCRKAKLRKKIREARTIDEIKEILTELVGR